MESSRNQIGTQDHVIPQHCNDLRITFCTVRSKVDIAPVLHQANWEEFCRCQKHVERDEKDGQGFIFNELDGNGRSKENVRSITAIVLDIERQNSAAPPVEHMAEVLKSANYTALIYTTFSHSCENPRYRLIFPIDRSIMPTALVKATRWVINHLNLTDCTDPASWSFARLMYAPTCRRGSIRFIGYNLEGAVLSGSFLESLPDIMQTNKLSPVGDSSHAKYSIESNGTPYGIAALDAEYVIMLNAPTGQSNRILNKAAIKIGSLAGVGQIEPTYARNRLYDAAMQRKPGCHDEIVATINSGFEAGRTKPMRSSLTGQIDLADLNKSLPKTVKQKYEQCNAGVQLRCGAEIKPMHITWLWKGWLPSGKLTLLAGNAGTGKTTLALAIGAICTNAGSFPDGGRCEKAGNVLIWSGEDVADDTLVPRLIASGADMSRCFFIEGFNTNGEIVSFDPATHINALHKVIQDIQGISLLIIDPIVSAISGDMHKANDVRRSLQPVVDFAESNNCAVIGITHFAKGGAGSSPQDRVIGSQAFGAVARMVLVAAKEESSTRRVLARAKSNIAKDDGGIAYSLNITQIANGIEASYVIWDGTIEGSAREILGDVECDGNDAGLKRDHAKDFLIEKLRNGAVEVTQLKIDAMRENFKWRTMERAKSALGIKPIKTGFGGAWSWTLPDS